MDKDGISYKIIKNKLPIINEEIVKVLSNIVDFEVFFENSDDSLEINIKHPKFDPRPLSAGSGQKNLIANMSNPTCSPQCFSPKGRRVYSGRTRNST